MKTKISIIAFLLFIIGCSQEDSINEILIDGDRITAAFNLGAVESFASSFSEELKLLSLRSEDVSYDGFARKWCFIYRSGEIPNDYYFHTTSTGIAMDSTSTSAIFGITYISHQWINSNEALSIAEINGGTDFRMKNPDYIIEASLSEPLVPNSVTFWYITYYSKSDRTKSIMLTINANSGEIIYP